MKLKDKIMQGIKQAMKSGDKTALESLRAIKSAILLAETDGSGKEITEETEIKILQKLVKQRRDSAALYQEQGREDLAGPELAQAEVIASFLPEQASEEEIRNTVAGIIQDTGASGMKDMGRVMGAATKALAGKADGKTISAIVKDMLS